MFPNFGKTSVKKSEHQPERRIFQLSNSLAWALWLFWPWFPHAFCKQRDGFRPTVYLRSNLVVLRSTVTVSNRKIDVLWTWRCSREPLEGIKMLGSSMVMMTRSKSDKSLQMLLWDISFTSKERHNVTYMWTCQERSRMESIAISMSQEELRIWHCLTTSLVTVESWCWK